ncbi:MAG: hypothetical protein ACYSTS_17880 [Planctomycetota bacterium]|jgi:hypothetical protein
MIPKTAEIQGDSLEDELLIEEEQVRLIDVQTEEISAKADKS